MQLKLARIWLFCMSVATVSSQNGTDKPNKPVQALCGNTAEMVDKCFADLPSHLVAFLHKSKIALTEKEINSKCTVFRHGMSCFEDYTQRCLSERKLNLFENNVEGARRFFLRLCGDEQFRNDYLAHKDCFAYIQEDWLRCTTKFHNIVRKELFADTHNVTDKFMEFCCARHAYESCIYNSANFKCYAQSAQFARATAQMLSDEKHFSNCRQFEELLCSGIALPVLLPLLLHLAIALPMLHNWIKLN